MWPIMDKLEYWAYSPEGQAEIREIGNQTGQWLAHRPLVAVALVALALLIVYLVERKNESAEVPTVDRTSRKP